MFFGACKPVNLVWRGGELDLFFDKFPVESALCEEGNAIGLVLGVFRRLFWLGLFHCHIYQNIQHT
jgi:hypothetical protein